MGAPAPDRERDDSWALSGVGQSHNPKGGSMPRIVEILRKFLIAEGRDGDRKVYHFLIGDVVLEIVI